MVDLVEDGDKDACIWAILIAIYPKFTVNGVRVSPRSPLRQDDLFEWLDLAKAQVWPLPKGCDGDEMFKDKLTRVVTNVPGSLGCLLIGFDGIPIDSVFTGKELTEMAAIAVELTNLLGKFRRMNLHDMMGDVNEVSITTGTVTTLARVIAEEYLLVLALSSEADINRGQTMLRLISPFVEREMLQ